MLSVIQACSLGGGLGWRRDCGSPVQSWCSEARESEEKSPCRCERESLR